MIDRRELIALAAATPFGRPTRPGLSKSAEPDLEAVAWRYIKFIAPDWPVECNYVIDQAQVVRDTAQYPEEIRSTPDGITIVDFDRAARWIAARSGNSFDECYEAFERGPIYRGNLPAL